MNESKIHYGPKYFINPAHRITIDLVGLGGTGSRVLNELARMNAALLGLGKPGLFVRCWDADIVEEANVGRGTFSAADIGEYKANILVTRVNRHFGTDWDSNLMNYKGNKASNILITCVDTIKARVSIGSTIEKKQGKVDPFDQLYYWLDFGNLQKTGQVILGTNGNINQPKIKGVKGRLKNVIATFPHLKKVKKESNAPSCSMAEALDKQDLFINGILAQFGCHLIWQLLKVGYIKNRGAYVNLENLIVNPIKIK
jgi:PRTRC genetic system ThiF family protein